MQVDLRDTAAFVRDPAARVNCAMLPFSLKMDVDMKVGAGRGGAAYVAKCVCWPGRGSLVTGKGCEQWQLWAG